MNKAFKVLWSRFRNSYVVASEATASRGKAGKAVKTAVAVAAALTMAGAAQADVTLTNDSFGAGGQYDSTKFISGNGQSLVIQTEGDARNFLTAIKSGDFEAIRDALGHNDKWTTPVGVAGGRNYLDQITTTTLGNLTELVNAAIAYPDQFPFLTEDQLAKLEEIQPLLNKVNDLIDDERYISSIDSNSLKVSGNTEVKIGNDGTTPLVVGVIGGDNVMNASVTFGSDATYDGTPNISVEREGSTSVTVGSGNIFGLIGGSSAINISGITAQASGMELPAIAESTSATLTGSSNIRLEGSASAAGLVGGGSAISLGGNSSSQVLGGSNITIATDTKTEGYQGVTVGVVGGGLAAATMGGGSNAEVAGTTTVELNSGMSAGVFGGGAAVSGDISKVVDTLIPGDYKDNILFDESKQQGGTATAESGEIVVSVGSGSTTVGLVGGGLAVAHAMWSASSPTEDKISASAASNAQMVTINIGEEGAGTPFAEDQQGEGQTKKDFFGKLQGVLATVKDPESDLISYSFLTKVVDAVNQKGVTVGVLGGGMSLAYQPNNGVTDPITTTTLAQTNVDTVNIDVLSGYNVGIFGSGFAAASAGSVGEQTRNAVSTVGTSNITLTGGETIGVMGGGISYFAGTAEPNTGVGAEASTDVAKIGVGGNASVDGIVGGGLAIDDTNPKDDMGAYVPTKNASSTVGTVHITVGKNATVNKLGFAYFFAKDHQNDSANEVSSERPNLADHLDALTFAMDNRNAAIVGGGLASGSRAGDDGEGIAHVGTVNITLDDNAVIGTESTDGNVFGGGIAANGAKSSVDTVNIAVQGEAQVNGDIYAGGIAQDGNYINDPEYFEKSLATVGKATINLLGGTINGDIYAGGLVSQALLADEAEGLSASTVETANINLSSAVKLNGNIDGSGADTSTLTLVDGYAFNEETETTQTVKGFDVIQANGLTTGFNYAFVDGKNITKVLGNTVEFASLTNQDTVEDVAKTLQVGDETTAGVAAITQMPTDGSITFKVASGMLALNTDGETAAEAAASAPSTAAAKAYVTDTVDLSSTTVLVGDVTSSATGLYVGSNGMLVADAAGSTSVIGTADFDAGATIHFANVAEGATVTIGTAGDTTEVGTSVDNVLYEATLGNDKHTYTFSKRQDLASVGLDGTNTGFLEDLNNHPDNPGAEYISQFLDQTNTSVNNGNRAQQINAAMNLAAAAGVQTMAIDGTMIGVEAANKRASIINNFVDGGVLFAEISGRHSEVGGDSGFGEIEADLGGIVVGGEYTTNDWTFGALANLGTGSVDGQGDNSGVENDVDYYGIQAYVGKRFGQFNLVGQIGYLMSENDISQKTIGHNTADVDADVWTVGLRGEFRFDVTDNSRLVPNIGLNYLRVSTDGYHTSAGVKVDDVDQNLWTMPVGVKYAGDMQTASGWTWTPSVDVAYIPAFGDDDVDATTDVGARGSTTMDVWADSVARMKFGIRANKDNFGIGLEAGAAAGSDDFTEYFGQVRVDYRF